MAESHDRNLLASSLLAQDSVAGSDQYRDYREKLARSLEAARFQERITYWITAVTGVISFLLIFVGGSGVLGSFDPWSQDATTLSIVLGVIFVVCSIMFWVLLASYYSRLRPNTRQAHENLRDIQILELSARLEAMRADVALLMQHRSRADDGESR